MEQPGRGSTRETEVGLAECQQAEYIHMCHRMVGVWVPDGMKATPWEADLKETQGRLRGPAPAVTREEYSETPRVAANLDPYRGLISSCKVPVGIWTGWEPSLYSPKVPFT